MFCQIVSDLINNTSALGVQKPSLLHSMTVSMATIVFVMIGTLVSVIFFDWICSNYDPQVFVCRNEKSFIEVS